MSIRVEGLSKRFGAFAAVDDVSFEVARGSLVALLGPSGSGKSTLLRILAGLERPDEGRVWFDGEDVTSLDPRRRSIGFVFQNYALFRHLTVAENVAFGLEVRRVPKALAGQRVSELLRRVGLEELEHRFPAQLSGGQRQRVALARALAPEPRLLLLDEPFGAVDAKVREELREWLRRLHDEVGVTSIFVTHDQDEAFSLADRVLLIHRGGLEQSGAPTDILDAPATEFVARFVGEVTVLPAVVHDGIARVGALRVPVPAGSPRGRVHLVMRSYDVAVQLAENGAARITRVVPFGDRARVYAHIEGAGPIVAQISRRSAEGLEPGARIDFAVRAARAYAVEAP